MATTIFSKVFIKRSCHQEDIPQKGVKAGDPLPLAISWKEAIPQNDGSYLLKAFLQVSGQKAKDITNKVYHKSNRFDSLKCALQHLDQFNGSSLLDGDDMYAGPINKNAILTDDKINNNIVHYVIFRLPRESVYTQANRSTLG